MNALQLLDPLPIDALYDALCALGASPRAALRDPVPCMRLVASADLETGSAFLRAVMPRGMAPDLEAFASEDGARLFLASVMAVVLAKMRIERRSFARRVEDERPVPA